jgi:hypothetical protein
MSRRSPPERSGVVGRPGWLAVGGAVGGTVGWLVVEAGSFMSGLFSQGIRRTTTACRCGTVKKCSSLRFLHHLGSWAFTRNP